MINHLQRKTLMSLYSKANSNAPVSLAILRIDSKGLNVGHPYQISKYEDCVGKPFDDLWDYMEDITAPRIKRNRV